MSPLCIEQSVSKSMFPSRHVPKEEPSIDEPFYLLFVSQDEEEDDEDMDSLFSPNASSVASPRPQSQNASLLSADDAKAEDGIKAADPEKDAPARRTRQNLCLKDKPLEVRAHGRIRSLLYFISFWSHKITYVTISLSHVSH